MLATVDVQDLSRGIVFIRMSPSVLDLILVLELAKLCGIHRNIAKLAYVFMKMT